MISPQNRLPKDYATVAVSFTEESFERRADRPVGGFTVRHALLSCGRKYSLESKRSLTRPRSNIFPGASRSAIPSHSPIPMSALSLCSAMVSQQKVMSAYCRERLTPLYRRADERNWMTYSRCNIDAPISKALQPSMRQSRPLFASPIISPINPSRSKCSTHHIAGPCLTALSSSTSSQPPHPG